MNGVYDPLYVLARRVLLDAIQALGPQLDAMVLVGAQAVYLRTGDADADLMVAPFTNDADVILNPDLLVDEPLLAAALEQAGFRLGEQPGEWLSGQDVPVDLMVPASMGGPGRRGARLGLHGRRAARKVAGLEGALVDCSRMTIVALDSSDPRAFHVQVAGPAALLVSKVFKIGERLGQPGRQRNKDALDTYRLLASTSTEEINSAVTRLLDDQLSRSSTIAAINHLEALFSTRTSPGIKMLVQAVASLEDGEFRAQACMRLVADLLQSLLAVRE